MAVPKVCGIETEYGVTLRGAPDPNPVLASSMLINGYVEGHRIGWDFEDESPGRDARGFAREGSLPPDVETHLVNTVLTNGVRRPNRCSLPGRFPIGARRDRVPTCATARYGFGPAPGDLAQHSWLTSHMEG